MYVFCVREFVSDAIHLFVRLNVHETVKPLITRHLVNNWELKIYLHAANDYIKCAPESYEMCMRE